MEKVQVRQVEVMGQAEQVEVAMSEVATRVIEEFRLQTMKDKCALKVAWELGSHMR